jgi:lactoylglutathione lyase
MKIEHVAIWVSDLEGMRIFYETYFNGISNNKYHNVSKQFESYFIRFDSDCRLELMKRPDIAHGRQQYDAQHMGLVHLAFAVGDKEKVDVLTEQLRNDGYTIAGEPRTTGDGYYESVVLDPEGNIVEITAVV